ncbi:LAMI_0F12420g1_1 [Lachancea mirantina]|uniref:LAMI_0F12420g1_1 n=1 Tax=Lachancea mirantina TaxID=1230905 RepID=A0A1G4K2V9_9SACH|nr:LAMI_0F12420g1_1 [Lachancea mirantina]
MDQFSRYPLSGIPVPFQYQIRNGDDSDAGVLRLMNKFNTEENGGHAKKRSAPNAGGADFDVKRARMVERSGLLSCQRDEGGPTPLFDIPFRFGLESGVSGADGSVSVCERRAVDDTRGGATAPQHGFQQLSSVNRVSSPVCSEDEGLVVSGAGGAAAAAAAAAASTAAGSDEGLPLSPVASPGRTPSEGVACAVIAEPRRSLQQDCLNAVAITAHSQLSPAAYKNLIFQLISRLNRSELSDLGTLVKDNLKRDFLSFLPAEIAVKILTNLDFEDISKCLAVNRTWNRLINNTPYLWRRLMVVEGFMSKDEYQKQCDVSKEDVDSAFRQKFLENRSNLKSWYSSEFKPHRTTLKGHSTSIVTCLQFEDDYIITGADDKVMRIYDAKTEEFVTQLSGHDGGVWALKYDKEGVVVSGSTDRSVRVWNIKKGKCTHLFRGHTSTVRCLDIVEHQGIKYIVTGSRDYTLRVWKLPSCRNENYNPDVCEVFNTTESNPYFVGVLRGHMDPVRTVSGHGNIVISGSYDHNLMIWDIAQMKCLYVLTGHTDRIYCTVYDHERKRCISASMDWTIRVWDLENIHKNGPCSMVNSFTNPCVKVAGSVLTLQGHTALVGLLRLSNKFLVSAAADGSLRGWDPDDFSRKFAYHHTNLSAITTFDVNDNVLVSGSEGQFNIYNLRTGRLVHSDLLSDADQIWLVKFNNRKLVAAVEKAGKSYVEILDFSRSATTEDETRRSDQDVSVVSSQDGSIR